MHTRTLQNEALLLLEGRGRILEVARRVSQVMRDAGINGAVIGGVAVVLHGYVRTTCDVDVFTADVHALGDALKRAAFKLDAGRREFQLDNVPVHLVTVDQIRTPIRETVEVDGVLTASLGDLLNMKLRSGSHDVLRAIDLADVIGLIRHHRLAGEFALRMDRDLRPAFRKLVKAIQNERPGP